ncbi:VanZ family protein [Winogradskyella sp. A3E31]|uniref:VanZ family protein n=1 Tax=Winogradskyella sp. A3E31 TaxID=3349637 RepID=UPI00398A7A14
MFYLFLLLIFAFIVSGLKHSDKRLEYWIYAGVIAVYGMAILRMDIKTSERSHMFEYGLLSLLIYEALTERKSNGVYVKTPVLISILGAGTVGLLDECIQYIIPYRVFDIVDIAFNYVASVIGVFISITVSKMKRMLMIW